MENNLHFKIMLKILAEADIPALLTGESGSGKEVAARGLHFAGKRKGGPFVAVNCGAVSQGLAEALFCGHSKGAFTGASCGNIGFVRAANGGTLFLDEVSELSPDNQKSLLRVLQEKSVVPVGEQREIKVDFRLVCATNKDLRALVAKGMFREDLFYRIHVMPIWIPPLRERLCDLRDIAESMWLEPEPLGESHFAALSRYSWPGNIRQLKNVLERYAILKPHGCELESIIAEEHGNCKLAACAPPRRKPSRSEIAEELKNCGGCKTQAAKNLGISRSGLYYKMKGD